MYKCRKSNIDILVVILAIFWVFLSCESPLSSNLGGKVDFRPPSIVVESPVPGAFLKGDVQFEGTADAYRELVSVDVKIHHPRQGMEDQPLLDWTRLDGSNLISTNDPLAPQAVRWTFTLDTVGIDLPLGQKGLDDGLLKIQFRANDPNITTNTVELVFVIKNDISDIKVTSPIYKQDISAPPRLLAGSEIRGQITDRKGLKPGYPMIKIWPTTDYEGIVNSDGVMGEPDDDHPKYGWARLFLQGYDDPMGTPMGGKIGEGFYADRSMMQVVRVAQFVFKLDDFTIDPETRQVRYKTVNVEGEHEPMEAGRQLSYKIKTSDSYFWQNTLLPRSPGEGDEAAEGEFETLGYYPPSLSGEPPVENHFDKHGPALLVLLVSSDELPVIRLDNDDIRHDPLKGPDVLNIKPNHYIREEEPTTRKIAVGDPAIPDFRLQVLAKHSDFIEYATLHYVHESSRRSGYLEWDSYEGNGGLGYMTSDTEYTRAIDGYQGRYKNPASMGEGKLFTFTAFGGLVENNPASPWFGRPIFTSSSEPYILEVTAVSFTGASNSPPQRYVVFMDGQGPTVRILGVKGATAAPVSVTYNTTQDDARNDEPYTVNSNIQVTINRVDDSGIMVFNEAEDDDKPPLVSSPNGYPKVKWIVEEDETMPPENPNSTLSKLKAYKAHPTKDGLEFFEKINEKESYTSGWVRTPQGGTGATREDMMHNLKFNTRNEDSDGNNLWDKKHLWLYIIAQDGVHNLGYILQKIYVDDDANMPDMGTPLSTVNAGGAGISGPDGLNVIIGSNRNDRTGNWSTAGRPRSNILEPGQGIPLNFSDDDGIVRDPGGMEIFVTNLNVTPHVTRKLTERQLAAALPNGNPDENNSSREWSGSLSQSIMAAAFSGINDPADIDPENPPSLRDGMYSLTIKLTDDVKAKVHIDRPDGVAYLDGDIPEAAFTEEKVFYFAVYSSPPAFDTLTLDPPNNSLQNNVHKPIKGTVKSRLDIQKMWITFTPDIITPNNGATSPLQTVALVPSGPQPDSEGYFVYSFDYRGGDPDGVNFSVFAGDPNFVQPRYSLEAYDRLGNSVVLARSVQVDVKDPDVSIPEFYNNRSGEVVNGKVHFIVSASDENGLKEYYRDTATDDMVPHNPDNPDLPPATHAAVKWWVRLAASPAPNWDDGFETGEDGTGGWFTFDEAQSGGRFEAIFNSTKLKNGEKYALYAIAQDKAGNFGMSAAMAFTVDQDTDFPTFKPNSLFPPSGIAGDSVQGATGLVITGSTEDDDRFDPNNKNNYVQIRFPVFIVDDWYFPSDPDAGWIPVPGEIDQSGVLHFRFDFDAYGGLKDPKFNGYFYDVVNDRYREDKKLYQLRITDEPEGPPPPPAAQTHFGKNPDGDKPGDPDYIPSVSRIFPHPNPDGTEGYMFLLDTAPPIIYFDHYDPNREHENYQEGTPSPRPTYRTLDALIGELKGKVDEPNLLTLTITYGTKQPFILLEGNTEDPKEQSWPTDEAALKIYLADFDDPKTEQGTQSVSLEAYDTAGNTVTVVWTFSKDTQGPQIIPTSISRAIRNPVIPASDTVFPPDPAWPSDFPYGPNWKSSTASAWVTFRSTYGVDNWPSEYAFLTPAEVIKALKEDHESAGNLSVVFNNDKEDNVYKNPVIRGRFQDELSHVRAETGNTYFWYRIRSQGTTGGGRDLALSADDTTGWEEKEIEDAAGQRPSAANWVIEIDDDGLTDGLNYLDIKMKDTAGNWSELYGMEFLLDRLDPHFGLDGIFHTAQDFEVSYDSKNWGALRTETERVFSSVYPSPAAAPAFTLSGSIYEHNLRDVSVYISQEGTGHSVEAKYDVENNTGDIRLIVTGTAPVYTWTLDILEIDIDELRGPNPNEGRRHFVRIEATDRANRRIPPATWNFFLDSKSPEIEYTNLEAGQNNNTIFSTESVMLTGVVSDDTKVQDLRYSIAKWDFAPETGPARWRWYDSAEEKWNIDVQPTVADWPSMLNPDPANPAYTVANAQSSVNWSLTQAELTASGQYPAGLFTINDDTHEGRYKIDLYAKDWSLGSGNPIDTRDTGHSRQFYIDRHDPIVAPHPDTDARQYFNNAYISDTGFQFYVSDNNTITDVEADLLDSGGNVVFARDSLKIDISNSGSTLGTVPYIPPSDGNPNPDNSGVRLVTVKPNMADGAIPAGIATYTLRLYVFDGAGRQATINNTKQFILDNNAPELTLTPGGGNDTITGKVAIKGNASDDSFRLSRVAYYVANREDGWLAPDDPLIADNVQWRYNEGAGSPSALMLNDVKLVEIDEGTFTWELRIPNTRNFLDALDPSNPSADTTEYVQWSDTSTETGLRYNGELIDPDMEVGLLTIYFLIKDEAGNGAPDKREFWIYPEGDRPVVTSIRNPDKNAIEMERQFNGSIRISGQARDNERVRNVWFRVLNENGNPYSLTIPEWNEKDWTKPDSTKPPQTAQTSAYIGRPRQGDDPGDGWYMANRGGDTDTVASWWAMINTMGELDRGGSNRIVIEVRAEDTTENETWNDLEDKWLSSTYPSRRGLLSLKNEVTAFVVAGAPIFEDEWIALGSSDTPAIPWGHINETNIRGRASYRITVKDDNGVSAIRWSKTEWAGTMNNGIGGFRSVAGTSVNILDPLYLTNTYPGELLDVDDPHSDTAMAVKAEPHPDHILKTAPAVDKFYYIWNPISNYGSIKIRVDEIDEDGDPVTERFLELRENVRGTVFELVSGTPSGGTLLEQVDGFFLWLVTVDVHTGKLEQYLEDRGYGNTKTDVQKPPVTGTYGHPERDGQIPDSVQYPVYLSASDISRPTPLSASRTAFLPIDHHAPTATYTLNRRPAGISVPVGGEAADEGPVSGVARVVLWFSRLGSDTGSGRPREYVSWHERPIYNGMNLVSPPGVIFRESHTLSSGDVDWAAPLKAEGVIPSTAWDGQPLKVPYIPGLLNSSNSLASGGDWAIVIDRNNPSVGTNHHGHNLPMGFSAGGTGMVWYVELNSTGLTSGPVTMHFVVLDQAGNARYYEEPLVIMNNAPMIDRIKLGTAISEKHDFRSLPHTGVNKSVSTGHHIDGTSEILGEIRSHFPGVTRDVSMGISDYIPATALNVDRIIDFNARNELLALRMETTGAPAAGKERQFSFEYVSGAAKITSTVGTAGDNQLAERVKAGRVYIIDDPGTISWGSLGAEGQGPWPRGYAFLAAVDGKSKNGDRVSGSGSAWELNGAYYDNSLASAPDTWIPKGEGGGIIPAALELDDTGYAADDDDARSAEFSYASGAFGTTPGSTIIDFAGSNNWPPATDDDPARDHSLFILKVYDGVEEDLFCDFALIRIRVNNNDVTPPFSQLYDLNPMTEGQNRPQSLRRSVSPQFVGEGTNSNRTKGGLWNTDERNRSLAKPGHIEPRRMEVETEQKKTGYGSAYAGNEHSLTSQQMGGAADRSRHTDTSPWANPLGYFDKDTVSGQVVLRGYAEDDQRIEQIDLIIGDTTITILEYANNEPHAGDSYEFDPPNTGFLAVPSEQITGGVPRVYFSDSIDLYRHRVEWAYVWDTESIPSDLVIGSVDVSVLAYNRHSAAAAQVKVSEETKSPGLAHATAGLLNYEIHNPGFPIGLNKYNHITMNLRPYITGFARNKDLFRHDTRSLQGRYIFARNEQVVVHGFNLGTGEDTVYVILPGEKIEEAGIISDQQEAYGLESDLPYRYRIFTIPADAVTNAEAGSTGTTNGTIMLRTGSGSGALYAVNTRLGNETWGERPLLNAAGTAPLSTSGRRWVQPWNTERSPGIDGSDLWEDFIAVHIWQSNNEGPENGNNTNEDKGAFPTKRGVLNTNWVVLNPAMSIDPRSGVLWSSKNEGGAGRGQSDHNDGNIMITSNSASWAITGTQTGTPGGTTNERESVTNVMQFVDPIIMSDVYFSPGNANNSAHPWTTSSIIGRSGTDNCWISLGGVYVAGPDGADSVLSFGLGQPWYSTSYPAMPPYPTLLGNAVRHYLVEKTWYNASSLSAGNTVPPSTDQFENPHIVTYLPADGNELIHVSYYDTKDRSIKYRLNTRREPGPIAPSVNPGPNINNPDNNNTYANPSRDFGNNTSIRKWINLDGGWDAEDENSGAGMIPQQFTLQEANDGPVADGSRFIREVYVENNGTVAVGDPVYRLGTATRDPGDATPETIIRAKVDGTITLNYPLYQSGNDTHGVINQGSLANRFVRAVAVQNYEWVENNTLVYTFGPATGTSNPTTVRTTSAGYITLNYPVVGEQVANNDERVFTVGNAVYPTLQVANNNVPLDTGTPIPKTLQEAYGSAIPSTTTATSESSASLATLVGSSLAADSNVEVFSGSGSGNAGLTTSNNYLRYINPDAKVGNTLKQGDLLFIFGPQNETNTAGLVHIYAPRDLTINRIMRNNTTGYIENNGDTVTVTWSSGTEAAGNRVFTLRRSVGTSNSTLLLPASNSNIIYRSNHLAANVVRWRKPLLANNQWVTQGDHLYTFGAAAANATVTDGRPRTEYVVTAPATGVITNIVNLGATAPTGNSGRLFTITSGAYNYLRKVHVIEGQYVQVGDPVYTYGVAGEIAGNPPYATYTVTATNEGAITGLLTAAELDDGTASGNRTFITQTANNAAAYTINTSAYNFVRQAHVTEGQYVTAGTLLYTFGASPASVTGNTHQIFSPVAGIVSDVKTATSAGGQFTTAVANRESVITITRDYHYSIPLNTSPVYSIGNTFQRIVDGPSRPTPTINAGFHNAIAVTSDGCPVVAYFDATNSRLKMAVSNSQTPSTSGNWRIIDPVIPAGMYQFGTGQFVSMKIDTRETEPGGGANQNRNRVHIAALNANTKKLVYISGIVYSSSRSFSADTIQVVDNVGDVGRWCTISLDANGNPWIAYHDESYSGSRDGIKMAYRNSTAFAKTLLDMYGTPITGWETMHVPTGWSVENARTGMECYPTRNYEGTLTRPKDDVFWSGAVAYMAPDYFRIAYYVK